MHALKKILIFGNSGSGKSTLAKTICELEKLSHLDLDTLAWHASNPPKRKPLVESAKEISSFIEKNKTWVIEGCYTDLLEIAAPFSTEIIFMNLPLELCIANAKNRPWEPHKYPSKQAQDKNLEMLIDWIKDYSSRNDTFSQLEHMRFFEEYSGEKTMYTSNEIDIF